VTRASLAQLAPDPDLDWATFPAFRPRTGTVLWRAARRGREPWWFCTCGNCRFDLDAPRGTCYAGTDELSGILENIGYEWASGSPLTLAFLRGRTLHASVAAGLLDGPLASGPLMGWGEPGPGKWVTIYANHGHVYLEVAGIRFDTSGQRVDGSRWQNELRGHAGFVARHPPGL